MLSNVLRTLLPIIEKAGIASEREIDIDTLESRLRDEAAENNGVIVVPEFIGAWAHRPIDNSRTSRDAELDGLHGPPAQPGASIGGHTVH